MAGGMMAENQLGIDTSSYPKAAPIAQQNPLDTIGKLQGIESNAIGIDQKKLQLVNQKWDYSSKVLGSLLNKPDLTGKDLLNTYEHLHKQGVLTDDQFAKEASSIDSLAAIERDYPNATPERQQEILSEKHKNKVGYHLMQGASTIEQLNHAYGSSPRTIDTGGGYQAVHDYRGQILPTSPVVPQGIPRTTETYIPGEPGQPGRTAPVGAGEPNSPGLPFNGAQRLPIAPRPDYTSPVNPARNAAGQPNNLTGSQTPIIGNPPFGTKESADLGLKQYNEDVSQASQTLQSIKPAQQALKLMDPEVIKGLTGTGPIAEKTSKILGALQGVGVLSTTEPVAQRQELVKKLAQYLRSSPSGQRSDAAQELAAKANADPNVQLLPALIKITRDNVALDRVNAAKALAFGNYDEKTKQMTARNDYHNYLSHKGSFANNIDERAFKLDIMPADEREKLREQVKKESKIKQDKFLKSVELAKQLKMYE